MTNRQARTCAEFRLPTQELRDDIPFYTKVLGMRMDMIYPADDPRVAVFSGHGLRVADRKGRARGPGNPAHPDRTTQDTNLRTVSAAWWPPTAHGSRLTN